MRAADFFEHFALDGSSGKSAKLGNEFPHRAMTPKLAISSHMRSEIALQPRGVVPMRAGRIARSPFFPSWIGCCNIDELFAAPSPAQGQMRIEPDVGFRECDEFIASPFTIAGHLIVILVPTLIDDGLVVCVIFGSLVT